MNVIFIEPSFPGYQKQFVRGLPQAGATVIGIGERPRDWLDDDAQSGSPTMSRCFRSWMSLPCESAVRPVPSGSTA